MTEKEVFEEQYAEIFGLQPTLYGHTFEIKDGKYVLLSMQKSFKLWQASAKREGFVLVPKEPTLKMSVAYQQNAIAPCGSLSISGYKAMLSAVEVQGND